MNAASVDRGILTETLGDVRMSAEKRADIETLINRAVRSAVSEALAAHENSSQEQIIQAQCVAAYEIGYRDGVELTTSRTQRIAAELTRNLGNVGRELSGAAVAALSKNRTPSFAIVHAAKADAVTAIEAELYPNAK